MPTGGKQQYAVKSCRIPRHDALEQQTIALAISDQRLQRCQRSQVFPILIGKQKNLLILECKTCDTYTPRLTGTTPSRNQCPVRHGESFRCSAFGFIWPAQGRRLSQRFHKSTGSGGAVGRSRQTRPGAAPPPPPRKQPSRTP